MLANFQSNRMIGTSFIELEKSIMDFFDKKPGLSHYHKIILRLWTNNNLKTEICHLHILIITPLYILQYQALVEMQLFL
jgi:hypothetical protein